MEYYKKQLKGQKMKKQQEKADPQEEIFDQFYDIESIASSTEQTGMIPSLPQSMGEIESYAKIQGVPKQGSEEISRFHSL